MTTRKAPGVNALAAQKLPREAVLLYNDFIHGEISRRAFLTGVKRLAGGLTAAAMVDALMPKYAQGQQVSRTEERIKATYVTIPSPQGNGSIKGYLVRPFSADTRTESAAKLPGVNRGAREPRPEPAHRRRGAALRPGQLHGLRAGRAHLAGRLPGRRLQGRATVRQARPRQDLRRHGLRRAVAEGAPGLHRQDRRYRLLLRRRGRQPDRGTLGRRPGRGGALLRRAARGGRRGQDQGGNPGASRRTRHPPGLHLADLRQGTQRGQCAPRGLHLPGRGVHGFNCDATPERYDKAAADLAWSRTIGWFNKYVRA